MVNLISSVELKQLMDENKAVLIDVREQHEYDDGHIPNSILIPKGDLEKANLSRFKGKKIVFHCQAGRRSSQACELCSYLGDVSTLEGGLNAWMAEGFPVERKE